MLFEVFKLLFLYPRQFQVDEKKLPSVRFSGREKSGDKRKDREKQVETGGQGYTGKVWRQKVKGAAGRGTISSQECLQSLGNRDCWSP